MMQMSEHTERLQRWFEHTLETRGEFAATLLGYVHETDPEPWVVVQLRPFEPDGKQQVLIEAAAFLGLCGVERVTFVSDAFMKGAASREEAEHLGPLSEDPEATDSMIVHDVRASSSVTVLLPYHREDGTGAVVWHPDEFDESLDADSWMDGLLQMAMIEAPKAGRDEVAAYGAELVGRGHQIAVQGGLE